MKSLSLRLWVTLLALAGAVVHAAPAVIAHKGIAAEKIDAATLKSVLLGKKVSWDSGGRVVLAVLKAGPVADEFLQKSAEMNASSFSNHWRRLAMTGGGSAPKFFEKEEDLRKFVAETPGAIGFVDAASANDSVAKFNL